jgi:hypothetical protein
VSVLARNELRELADPSSDDVVALVHELREGNQFVVLERDDGSFVQTLWFEDDTLIVENHDGNPDGRYDETSVGSRKDAVAVLLAWLAAEPGWTDAWTWRRAQLGGRLSRWRRRRTARRAGS